MTLVEDRSRLALPDVTLCAASSVNVAATVQAMERCIAQIDFGDCILFTDSDLAADHPAINVVRVPRITSSDCYSEFILHRVVDHVDTSHCLVVQWDGHVLDASRWRSEFLDYDYIGARWPQFADGHDVGNGGFSLRSLRLMQACQDPEFRSHHPEDVAIGRTNRDWLEQRGMRFAPAALADLFAVERAGDIEQSFGYHGIWHMPHAVGVRIFWDIYQHLDDRGKIRHDFANILKQLWEGNGGLRRALRLILDKIRDR
tara:strand:+ start:3601 stop:4374 length:774 start_codon:yes stop_codon:yes gene_type:complete